MKGYTIKPLVTFDAGAPHHCGYQLETWSHDGGGYCEVMALDLLRSHEDCWESASFVRGPTGWVLDPTEHGDGDEPDSDDYDVAAITAHLNEHGLPPDVAAIVARFEVDQ